MALTRGTTPQGMTLQDAQKEYEQNKKVFVGNAGKLQEEGIECILCKGVYSQIDMTFCKCEEGLICAKHCDNCTYKDEDGTCNW